MRFSVLGPLAVVDDVGSTVALGGSKRRDLLLRLLIDANRVVPTAVLIEDLWRGDPPPAADATLQSHVSHLRKPLGAGRLVGDTHGYRLVTERRELVAAVFEDQLGEGRRLLESGQAAGAEPVLAEALAQWHGSALSEVADADWAQHEAARLEDLRLLATELLLDAQLALGRHGEVSSRAEMMVALHPLRERLWALLITALYRDGRQADALRAYGRLRSLLVDELGIEPSAELRQLERHILAQDPTIGAHVSSSAGKGALTDLVGSPDLLQESPSGVVTFLFTDVEGSAGLWDRDEPGMDAALARHDHLVRAAIEAHGGHVFSTAGDSFAAAFTSPMEALSAAVDAQLALAEIGLRVRMAVHTGDAHERDGDYFGPAVNRTARLVAAGHGGQVLVTNAVAELVSERMPLRDLGEHRLRDLTSITRVWQALAPGLQDQFPPLRTLDEARSNLPQQRTSLVGRDDDVHALAAMMEKARVITVTGVGGIGKTRLALHAAAEALPGFPGGVWLASLGHVDAADAVGDVVLAAVGGRRQAERSTLATLAELTAARRLLVILDNCEHLLGAAADCAEAVVAGGQSVVVATSREPLAVDGERVFPVPSLADDAAVTLFADRARAVDPSFNVGEHNRMAVAEICRRLDRMPLALELAAARVRSLTVQEIAQRLGDRFRLLRGGAHGSVERHRTLRAAMQWSYDLLDPKDQAVFARLSVFAGGFTVDAAAAVSSDDAMDDLDTIDVLDALVSRSMVIADRSRATTRYSLLETLRQFGEDKLVAAGETADRRARHAQHLLAVAETGRIQMSTPHAARAMTDFGDEWDNTRAAFEWFAAVGDVDAALRLIMACHWYAFFTYHYELLGWAERAISLAGSQDHELWTAAAGTAAILRWATGDRAGTEALATEAVHSEEVRGSPPRLEPAIALAMFYAGSGQTQRASDALTVAERIAEREGDPVELGLTRFARVMADWMADPAAIGSFGEDAVRDAEATGNPHQLAFAYAGLLAVAVIRRDREQAVDAFERVRHWADMANNRYIMFAAPSFLAMLHEDEPREALSLVRDVVAAAIDAGFWANLDVALRRILVPLVHLGHCRAAALLLGGLTSFPTATPDTQRVIPRAKAALADTLGAELDHLLEQGRSLTRQQLARLALDEIDLCNEGV